MICKECGAYNPDHATYCKVCAANLKDAEAPEADESAETMGTTRTFVRPSWTVPSQQKAERPARIEEPVAEEAAAEAEAPDEEPVLPPVTPAEPEEEPEEAWEAPEEEPEPEPEDEDEAEDEEEEYVPVYQRPARKTFGKRMPVREEPEEDEDEDEDDYDEKDSDEDDSYEYEPTPPKRKNDAKKNGPLFWILLVAIIIVIGCIIVAGVLLLSSSDNQLLSCAAVQQTPTTPSTKPSDVEATTQAPDTKENDPNYVKMEEYVNDEGEPCVLFYIYATPHSIVTLQMPNLFDQVIPNESDEPAMIHLKARKSDFSPDVPLTESTYEVKPVVYRTEADGTTTQLEVSSSFVLTFPKMTIDLERPVANEEGVIMADKQNIVAISGHVVDHDTQVTIDGEPVTVYTGGLFMLDYNMTATEPTTVVIKAEKKNYVTETLELVIQPYVFIPEKMVLTVSNGIGDLKAGSNNAVTVRGTTLPNATLTLTSDMPSKVVFGAVSVDGEGNYSFMVSMDASFYGVSKITINAEKEEAESATTSFIVYRAYPTKDDFTKGYGRSKTYIEIGTKNPITKFMEDQGTYANGNYGFRITATVESASTGEDGVMYVKLKLASGETAYAMNLGDRWNPTENIGKKYNLYGNFLGTYEADGTSPLFAIFFAVSKK